MFSNLPPKDDCPQLIETIFDKNKRNIFAACGELPEIPRRNSIVSVVANSGTAASSVEEYASPSFEYPGTSSSTTTT